MDRNEKAFNHYWAKFKTELDEKYYYMARSIAVEIIEYEERYKSFRLSDGLKKIFNIGENKQ